MFVLATGASVMPVTAADFASRKHVGVNSQLTSDRGGRLVCDQGGLHQTRLPSLSGDEQRNLTRAKSFFGRVGLAAVRDLAVFLSGGFKE